MKVSLNSMVSLCQRYGCADNLVPDGVDKLIERIGSQLGEIESVDYIGKKYQGAVIVKVVSCNKHPNADKLSLCTIDDGGITPDVKRDDQGHVQVVCGAPNVHAGMLAVWLPPGSTVPDSYGKEPFVLEARELRGTVSNGMLASPKELDLGDSHDGILEIEESAEVKPGDLFGEKFGLDNDVIIDIENKMFTHRPDCFGLLGVARELAGIQNVEFRSPDWYKQDADVKVADAVDLSLTFRNEIPSLVPRFLLQPMSGVKVTNSPVWLQIELAKHGIRSINNIVDYTNYFMIETSQPLHAYDYDKVKALSGGDGGAVIEVRLPRDNERLKLLNGKEINPRQEAIMIATDKALIGLAGIMGGADTEVDETTRNIILEAGNFDMFSVRRTSMEHGLFTDALTRFSKGQSPLQNKAVMTRIISEISQFAGGKIAGPLIDDNHVEGRQWAHPPVPVATDFINTRLGLNLSAAEIANLLKNVEFQVDIPDLAQTELAPSANHTTTHQPSTSSQLLITAPFWRTDIEIREDVVEEIGRLYGYDKLPLVLPKRSIWPADKDKLFEQKANIREKLVKSGANEVLTYSFVHGNLLDKVGQDKKLAFSLSNALSPDLQYFRLSLLPSLLDKVHMNIKAGYDQFSLFELGKVHYHGEWDEADSNVPNEDDHVALVITQSEKRNTQGAAYYHAKRYLDMLVGDEASILTPMKDFDFAKDEWGQQLTAPYDPNRSALIVQDDQIWGVIGEFRASVRRDLKLPAHSAGFEINLKVITERRSNYIPLPKFPKVVQDITLKIPSETSFDQLNSLLSGAMVSEPGKTLLRLEPLSIYQKEDNYKQISFRLTAYNYQKTMTDQEVSQLLERAAEDAKAKLGAERI